MRLRDWYTCWVQVHTKQIIIFYLEYYLLSADISYSVDWMLHWRKKIKMKKIFTLFLFTNTIIHGLPAPCYQYLCYGLNKLYSKNQDSSRMIHPLPSPASLFANNLFGWNERNYGFVRCNSLINGVFRGMYRAIRWQCYQISSYSLTISPSLSSHWYLPVSFYACQKHVCKIIVLKIVHSLQSLYHARFTSASWEEKK